MVEQKYLENAKGLSNLLDALSNIGVNRDFYFSGFVADHQIMDQLRLSCSALSPGSNDDMGNMGLAIVGSLEKHYGAFIPESTLEDSVGVVDRLLCVPSDEYEAFKSAWRSSPPFEKRSKCRLFF